MSKLLQRLLAYLRLGAAEGEADPPAEPAAPAAGADDDLFGDDGELLDAAEEGGGTPAADPEETPALKEARRRAEEADRRADGERAAREELQRQIPAPKPPIDTDYEREEQQLAAARAGGYTAEQIALLEWQINSNRTIRATNRDSKAALQQAQDLQDRTAFERLEVTHPKVYKRYAQRVDAAVADMRAKGQTPAPRAAILRLMIGDDLLSGKVAPKKKAPPVERGRTPGVRSDVRGNGKGAMTEHEKRKARLQNVRI